MKSSALVLTFLLSAAGAVTAELPPPTAEGEPPRFGSEVELVTVDVVVADKKGNPVTDLKTEDFTVLEDGDPQKPVSFEKVELPAQPNATPAPPPVVSTNVDAETRVGRSFVIVFDDLHIQPLSATRAKEAIAHFLTNGTREGDRVTLVASGGGTWWTARMESGREQLFSTLKNLEGRDLRQRGFEQMGDNEALRIHLYGDYLIAERVRARWEELNVPGATGESHAGTTDRPTGGGPQIDPFVGMRAMEIYEESRRRNTAALDIMKRSLLSLSGTRGRKSMILVSEGFIYDSNLDQFRKVLQAARSANVVIYFLDIRGLTGIPSRFLAETRGPAVPQHVASAFVEKAEESTGSEGLASDSGGFTIKNTNDLGGGIQRIANETRAYYLIGYNPTNAKRDGKWRKIQVKVNRKGLQVRARKGYYAPADDDSQVESARRQEDRVHDEFRQALDSPRDMEGIPLRMSTYVMGETLLGKATTVVVADIDTSRFSFEEKENRYSDSVETALVVTQQETGEFWDRSETIEFGVPVTAKERLKTQPWHSLTRDFDLPPGTFQAKIAVRHPKTGRLGTVTHEFKVPPLATWRVSSVVLTDTALPPAVEGDAPQPKPVARRVFKSPGLIFGKFEVYGTARDTATRAPKVDFSYVLRNKEGATLQSMQPREIPPTGQGAVRQLFAFRTAGWAPGEYELVLTIRDAVSGESKDVRESFAIEKGEAAAAEAPPAPAGS
jgi:VWFA-related protein